MTARTTTALLFVLTLIGTLATCTFVGASGLEPNLHRVVVGDQEEDAGGRGVFLVKLSVLVDTQRFGSARPTALGPAGQVAGTGYDSTGTQLGFLTKPETPETVEVWEVVEGGVLEISAISRDGTFCGGALWRDPILGGVGSTAVSGTLSNFSRDLPDPVTSDCRDRDTSGRSIGEWMAQGYLREPDGGVLRLDLFPNSPPQNGFIQTQPRALNSRGDLVGLLAFGSAFARGNPAALVRFADGGTTLLDNGPRAAVAADVNDEQVIVGNGRDHDDAFMPIVWATPFTQGMFLPLPAGMVAGEARALNNAGLIVGVAYDDQHVAHGVLWWSGRPYLADSLVALPVNFTIDELYLVNDEPRVAGTAIERITSDNGDTNIKRWPVELQVLQLPE